MRYSKVIQLDVNPVAKPRMTQRDRWKKRNCVLKYHAFKDELRLKLRGFDLPAYGYHLLFVIPMPKSWSQKKRRENNLQPHMPRPDRDNLEKAFLDAILEEDSGIWDGRITKVWGERGLIVIGIMDEEDAMPRLQERVTFGKI